MDQDRGANSRRLPNKVELAGTVSVTEGPAREQVSAYVDVTVASDRDPGRSDRIRVAFFGDAAASALAFKGDVRPVLVTGYLTTRFDQEAQKRVASITGTSIEAAPENMLRRNYVEVGGFLGQDPELRGGAISRSRVGLGIGKDKFVPVVGFAEVAEQMVESFHRGDGVTFEGRLSNHSFLDRAQGNRQRCELQVIASKVTLEHAKQISRSMAGEIVSEPAFSSNGKARFAFSLSTTGEEAGYPDRERVTVSVIAFDKAAVALRAQGFAKAQHVVVDGKIRENEYQGKTALEVRPTSVVAREMSVEREQAVQSADLSNSAMAPAVDQPEAAVALDPEDLLLPASDVADGAAAESQQVDASATAIPGAELPKVTTIVERSDFPDPIVGTIAGLDEDGRLLAHIGRGIAVAIDMDACSPRVPAVGEKVLFVRDGAQELVRDVQLAPALELAK